MRGGWAWTMIVAAGVSAVAMTACGRSPSAQPDAASAIEPFVPGLGEIMSLQQMRHVKLWFAGTAGNWKLASYEVDELGEGFDDAVRFHPTHKDSPVALKDVIPRMVNGPLDALRAAIQKQDQTAFTAAYDQLTNACNGCHVATNFEFNRVQRPASNPYPNQAFEPAGR
jgi:hypothetical protein